MARLHVWIEGVVQGVVFRESTRGRAADLGLTGWVRNLSDGRVEAVFQGDRSLCERAMDYVRVGPPSARVVSVDSNWDEEEEAFDEFRIRF